MCVHHACVHVCMCVRVCACVCACLVQPRMFNSFNPFMHDGEIACTLNKNINIELMRQTHISSIQIQRIPYVNDRNVIKCSLACSMDFFENSTCRAHAEATSLSCAKYGDVRGT